MLKSFVFFCPVLSLSLCWADVDLGVVNAEISNNWQKLEPTISQALNNQLQSQLLNAPAGSGDTQVSVKQIKSLQTDLTGSPGFMALDASLVSIDLPISSKGWSLHIDTTLHVVLKRQFITEIVTSFDVPLTVTVSNIHMTAEVGLDSSDPNGPTIDRVDIPQVNYELNVTSNNDLVQLAVDAAKNFIDQEVRAGVQNLTLQFDNELMKYHGRPLTSLFGN